MGTDARQVGLAITFEAGVIDNSGCRARLSGKRGGSH